jgi:hypothetical protein
MPPLSLYNKGDYMSESSQALLYKALALLADSYDPEKDSFFVVVTKDGKNPTVDVSDQKIVGEINLKTLVAFTVQAISQFCASVELNPHVFISRYLIGAILETERDHFCGFSFGDDVFEDDFEEEDDDEPEIGVPLTPHWTEIEN